MKNLSKVLLSFIFSISLLLSKGQEAYAVNTPNFPTCSNPSGNLIVSYVDGNHGIVGSTATYTGSDKVYALENGNVMQCFCSIEGSGIQTNWWKISSLSQDEIQTLKNLGWYFVPSGTPWGLDQGPYMAYNTPYSCGGTTRGTSPAGAPECKAEKPSSPQLLSVQRNGTKATLTWTKVEKATHYVIAYGTVAGLYPYGVPNTGNQTSYVVESLDPNKEYNFVVYAVNDCMPSNPSTLGGGQVLGLAATGTSQLTLILALAGLSLTTAGYFLSKAKSN